MQLIDAANASSCAQSAQTQGKVKGMAFKYYVGKIWKIPTWFITHEEKSLQCLILNAFNCQK